MNDSERLDWLSTATADGQVAMSFNPSTGTHWVHWRIVPRPVYWRQGPGERPEVTSDDGLRAAIDAAMERERGQ
jgi:hypothetical protein